MHAIDTLIEAVKTARARSAVLDQDANAQAAARRALLILHNTLDKRMLNAEYRAYRLARTAAGLPITPYPAWMKSRARGIMRLVAIEIGKLSK